MTFDKTMVSLAVSLAVGGATGIGRTAKQLARELAPIRVNVVSPGLPRTEAYDGMGEAAREAMSAGAAGRSPAGRVAEAAISPRPTCSSSTIRRSPAR